MTENQVWVIRDIFNDGISFLRKTFDSLDRKAQFWMALSLSGIIGLPSYAFQQDLQLSPYFILIACSSWVCFLPAIYFLKNTLELKTIAIGVGSIKKGKDVESLNYFLESEKRWGKFGWKQNKCVFEAYNMNLKACKDKSNNLDVAEKLLFLGIPFCVGLSLLVGFFITYIIADNFWLFWLTSLLGPTPTGIFCGSLIGICVCVFIIFLIFFRHRNFPNNVE